MKCKKYLLVLLMVAGQKAFCQHAADTAALVKEFTKIMAFTTQPYLYYTTVTKVDTRPLLNDKDTISTIGVFYKSNDRMYCNTMKNEMYVEDSLLVQINNDSKTIWISRATASGKGKLNTLPAVTKKMQELLQKSYTISKTTTPEGLSRISFETRKQPYSNSTTSAIVVLEYAEDTKLPKSLSVEMNMKRPANDEMLAALKEGNVDEKKLLQNIDGINYIVTMQRMNVSFTDIQNTKEKTDRIPSYKEKVSLNEATGKYTGTGIYREYEITKTF